MKYKSVLITGSKGFIGSHLMKIWPDAVGIDYQDGIDLMDCDLPSVDLVIHLAAQTSVINSIKRPMRDARENILVTIRLLQKYKKTKFIYASSGGAIQETIESPYGLSKFCAEQYVKMLHKDAVILRFPNIFGPGSHSVVEKFIEGDVNIYGDGTATRDYVHVDDLIKAIQLSLDWPVGIYSLGSGKNTSVMQLAEATGKPINHLPRIKGELQDSFVPNNTDWRPTINVLEYIKNHV